MAASPVPLARFEVPALWAKSLPAWRIRWFWRRQAWRLRKVPGHETGHGAALYDSLQALDRLGYVEDVCALHQQLQREAALCGDDAPAALSRRLARELQGHCVMALLGGPDGSPVGYAWARSARLGEALQHYRQVQSLGHLTSDDWLELERRAAFLVGDAPVLAINGIGLASRYRRGFAPLKQLLKPLLDLARQTGANSALWWAPRGSALHMLSLGLGAEMLLETPRIVCLLLRDLRPLACVFAALPASGIADLLARIAPARPPPSTRPPLQAIPKRPGAGGAAAV